MKGFCKRRIVSIAVVLSMLISLGVAGIFKDSAVTSAGKKISLNAGKVKTLNKGKGYLLKVKNIPKSVKKVSYKWTTSKSSVASVSKKGKVKAKKEGTAKITCRLKYTVNKAGREKRKNVRLTCKIRVISGESEPVISESVDGKAPTAAPLIEETTAPAPSETVRPDSKAYVKNMGIGINLGNTMESYWTDDGNKTAGVQTIGENTPEDYETCWGAEVTTQKVIDGYRDAGFSTVRIPVYWGNMMADDGQFMINDKYIQRVKEIVDYCLNDGMFAVINIHHYDEFLIKNYSESEVLGITEKLWTQIAGYFRDYSDKLIFEGFNESLGSHRNDDNYTEDELYDYVNALNQTFVDAVRKTAGNNTDRMLVVSGWWTNIDKTPDERFHMPKDIVDDRLMVSVHYIDNAVYWANKIGNQGWLEESRKQCELLKEAFIDKGIPVFVGECTSVYDKEHMAYDAEYTESSACLSLLMNMAVDYGFIPVLWDTNDNMYSRTEYCLKSEGDRKVISEIARRISSK